MNKNNQPICEICTSGTKRWYLDNKVFHREDGPAIEYAVGTKCWYLYGQRHRENGPAIENANGYKSWYLHDQLHRLDGPAIECVDGPKYWYYYGKHIDCDSQEEFERLIKLKYLW